MAVNGNKNQDKGKDKMVDKEMNHRTRMVVYIINIFSSSITSCLVVFFLVDLIIPNAEVILQLLIVFVVMYFINNKIINYWNFKRYASECEEHIKFREEKDK